MLSTLSVNAHCRFYLHETTFCYVELPTKFNEIQVIENRYSYRYLGVYEVKTWDLLNKFDSL